MLSIKKISGSGAAVDYYARYAQEKGEAKGRWLDEDGLLSVTKGEIEHQEMLHLLRGFSPDGRTALCQNAGDEHQPGWDLTFSAPKSVSIAWSNADYRLRTEIEACHQAAIGSALEFLSEEAIRVRAGKGGAQVHRGKMVAAAFQHSSNRAGEPQLHSHVIVFNVAKSAVDQRWRTLHPYPLYRAYMAAGALYKTELAYRMRGLGFEVHRTKDSFALTDIPTHVCDAQSSRSKAIEEELAQRGLTRANASAATRELVALSTRANKDDEKVVRDFARWQHENGQHGFGPVEQQQVLAKRELPVLSNTELGGDRQEVVAESLRKITEHSSTFNLYDLYRRLAEASIGKGCAHYAKDLVKEAKASAELVNLGPNPRDEVRYSTKEMVAIEQANLQSVADRQLEGRHLVASSDVERVLAGRPTIKPEQAEALRYLTTGREGVAFIEGDAGTGKSFLMNGVKEAYEASGYQVLGVSFTNKAAKNLEEGSGIKDCQSVDALIAAYRNGSDRLNQRTILVLDEAGMLDSRKMKDILDICQEKCTKLICVGDQKQIQPIAAGQAFGAMKRLFGGRRLMEIMRQREGWLKDAIRDFSEGKAKHALDAMDQRGALTMSKSRRQSREALIHHWGEQVRSKGLQNAPMIVATSNREVETINQLARDLLVANNTIATGVSLDLSHGPGNFAPGDRIVFTANDKQKGIYNSSVATIEKVVLPRFRSEKPPMLTVTTETGKRIKFDLTSFNSFRHAYAITAHKSQGSTVDQVMIMVDGPLMDREKFYVAISRGKEDPKVYADQESLGGLSYEDQQEIASQAVEHREKTEREILKTYLAKIVGTSHEKDTSQDYALPSVRLQPSSIEENSDIENRWDRLKSRVSEQLRSLQHRLSLLIFDRCYEQNSETLEKNSGYER